MEIKLKSGATVEVGSIEDLQDLYAQLHTMLGEKVKIVGTKHVIIEKQQVPISSFAVYGINPQLGRALDELNLHLQ